MHRILWRVFFSSSSPYLVEVVEVNKLLAELYSPHGVPHLVQGRRPEGDAHHVGDDQDQGTGHTGFGGEANLT